VGLVKKRGATRLLEWYINVLDPDWRVQSSHIKEVEKPSIDVYNPLVLHYERRLPSVEGL
jgi:hypothetical protein